MTMRKLGVRKLSMLLAAVASLTAGLSALPALAQSQTILQEQGTLRPTQDDYTFSGTAGQTVAISMTSSDFDTLLILLDANGEEIARNDDYARSLNSTIVIELPTDGTYTVVARSFSGMGGNYDLAIRPATPYDLAYSRAVGLYQQGDFAQAITAYEQAIAADPTQPLPYIERADARYAQSGAPSPEMIADYERAAELYEQAGDADTARSLREQITYLQSPQPAPEMAP